MITYSFAKEDIDAGEMVTKYQLYVLLGLAAFPTPCAERDAIIAQGDRYFDMAKEMGGRFYAHHNWLGAVQVLYIKKLINSICRKEWAQIASQSVEVNLWEERAKECRAKRAFALAKHIHMDSVKIEDVRSSPEGLDTWASCTVSATMGSVPKPRAKAKAKAGASSNSGGPSVGRYEIKLKSMIGTEILTLKTYNDLCKKVEQNPDKFSWATAVLADTAKQKEAVDTVANDEFLQKFKAAALCPAHMKELKKEMGDNYMAKMMTITERFQEAVEAMGKSITKATEGLTS